MLVVLLPLVCPATMMQVPPETAVPVLSKAWNVTFAGSTALTRQKNFAYVTVSPIRNSNGSSVSEPSPALLLPTHDVCAFANFPLLESLMNVTAEVAPTAVCTNAVVAI